MEFEKVIAERQSVRKFKEQQISQEQLDKILNAGNLALTAKDNQPQRIFVCQSKSALEKIDKASICRHNAPTVLLVCANKEEAFHKKEYSSYEMDGTIVATHMILEAYNVGVGSLWVLLFDNDIIKQEFELEENIEPLCLIMLGYTSDDYAGNPKHNIRKDLSSIVFYK